MFKLPMRITEKQRHTNRRNLVTRITNHDGESFTIDGTKDAIVDKFGQVMTKEGKYLIVLKGQAYRITFDKTFATLYTKPFDPLVPVVS